MVDFGFGKEIVDTKDAVNVLKLGNESVSGSTLDNILTISRAIYNKDGYWNKSGHFPPEFFAVFTLWLYRFYFNKFAEKELKDLLLKLEAAVEPYKNEPNNPAVESKAWAEIGEALKEAFQGKDSNWNKIEEIRQADTTRNVIGKGWENITEPVKTILDKIKAFTERSEAEVKKTKTSQLEVELQRAMQGAVTTWLRSSLEDLQHICKKYEGGILELTGLPEDGEWFSKAKLRYHNGDIYLPRTLVMDKIKNSEAWHEWINIEAKEHAGDEMSKNAMENTHAENEATTDTATRQGEDLN